MKRFCIFMLAALGLAAANSAPPLTLPLWEGDPPGLVADAGEEKAFNEVTTMNVSTPAMRVYLPPREKASGMAIVYCSGGSYNKVSHVSDAIGNADYFLAQGTALIVVKYRTTPPAKDRNAALTDARRAMRVVRHRAHEWGIDPSRIGMLGRSAGAHLILRLATAEHRGHPESNDPVERESCRPAFVGSLCPWPGKDTIAGFPITQDSPPMFLCSARDDAVAPTAFAEGIAGACNKAGVKARLWVIEKGGHGAFRLGSKGEGAQWATRFTEWLRQNAFDKPTTKTTTP